MKKLYFLLILFITISVNAQNVTITKIIETGCPSSTGFLKTVELYVDGTVDFSTDVILNYMNNGKPWSEIQIDVSALGTISDKFVYLVRDISVMQAEFPNTTFDSSNTIEVSSSTNGDDGYQVVLNGNVVSQFGRTETDADNDSESDWNHNDAVATRKNGIPDIGTWDPSHWEITAENALDDHTSCQNEGSTNLETYFATLGSTFSLGSGSGWTPTAAVCTTTLGDINTSCMSAGAGSTDDTYTAYIDFAGGNNGKTFTLTTTSGAIGGDNPTSMVTGTIEISGISEGTDITVTLKDTADGGVCDLSTSVESPACIPLIINEVLFDPANDDAETTEIEGDANGDGTRDALQDEFIELFNVSSTVALDISGYKLFDASALGSNSPRHIFPENTIIPPRASLVLFGGGTPTGDFGGAIVQTASEGTEVADRELNLSNGGDLITIKNTNDDVALVYSSVSTGINHSNNQSVTRSPDITGSFVLHSDVQSEVFFSPGLKIDGATLRIIDNEIENLVVYPNPASFNEGFINITTSSNEPLKVTIFDVIGKKMSAQTLKQNKLDISSLNTGLYLLKIVQGDALSTNKLIIK